MTQPLHSGSNNNIKGFLEDMIVLFLTPTTHRNDWVILPIMLTVFNLDNEVTILSVPKTSLNVVLFSTTSPREVMMWLESHYVGKVCFYHKLIISLFVSKGWSPVLEAWNTAFFIFMINIFNFLALLCIIEINHKTNFHLCDSWPWLVFLQSPLIFQYRFARKDHK